MSELKVDPVDQFCAACRSVRFNASMNSRLMTGYAAGGSRRSVARRPPASALAAAKPVSRSELTSNGVSLIASSSDERLPVVEELGAVCAHRDPAAASNAAAIGAKRRAQRAA